MRSNIRFTVDLISIFFFVFVLSVVGGCKDNSLQEVINEMRELRLNFEQSEAKSQDEIKSLQEAIQKIESQQKVIKDKLELSEAKKQETKAELKNVWDQMIKVYDLAQSGSVKKMSEMVSLLSAIDTSQSPQKFREEFLHLIHIYEECEMDISRRHWSDVIINSLRDVKIVANARKIVGVEVPVDNELKYVFENVMGDRDSEYVTKKLSEIQNSIHELEKIALQHEFDVRRSY